MTEQKDFENLKKMSQAIQSEALPGVWAQGLAHFRNQIIRVESKSPSEVALRAQPLGKAVAWRVSLWPEEQDWFCDCGEKNDPCSHVAGAAAMFLRNNFENLTSEKINGTTIPAVARPSIRKIVYRFKAIHHSDPPFLAYLVLERWIEGGILANGNPAQSEKLNGSLVAHIGGIQAGRIRSPFVSTTRLDFAIDRIVSEGENEGVQRFLPPKWILELFRSLENTPDLSFELKPVQVFSKPLKWILEIHERSGDKQGEKWKGYELKKSIQLPFEKSEDTPIIHFDNGGLFLDGKLYFIGPPPKGFYTGFVPFSEALTFFSENLHHYEKSGNVMVIWKGSTEIPKRISVHPRAVLNLEDLGNHFFAVTPTLVYGNPPLAEVVNSKLKTLSGSNSKMEWIPTRDLETERQITRRLQIEFHLTPGQVSKLDSQSAAKLRTRLERLEGNDWVAISKKSDHFVVSATLVPKVWFDDRLGSVRLEVLDVTGEKSVDPVHFFRAWREHEEFVPLLGGGWGPLPLGWLEKYGKQIESLLAAQRLSDDQKLPRSKFMETALALAQMGAEASGTLTQFRLKIDGILQKLETRQAEKILLPSDLKANLRDYQKKGVQWLGALFDLELGGLLADDMGLGKTLQILCSLRGRTLIICPTSVIFHWVDQIQKFRPSLSFSIYYGNKRNESLLEPRFNVVVVPYSILRIDVGILSSQMWDTLVIDEAQTIKNPESQASQALFQLKSKNRVALTGTPIENSLLDLWSIFRFLNPGMLDELEEFRENTVLPIGEGQSDVLENLKAKIKPFLLRRMKSEVATELPPRTESVLWCEFSEEERSFYDSLYMSIRRDVQDLVEEGGARNVIQILEFLLRLRQACCHPSLVPGPEPANGLKRSSTKIGVLMDALEECVSEGHRCLVFSQWTSLLDLCEPFLNSKQLGFLRLDGASTNRQEIVEQFQSKEGPPILLLTLKAGGVGLNLTAADHVFIMDPWWNPAAESQAADRSHRIGQTNPVFVKRLIVRDTVEERILELQTRKKMLADSLLENAAQAQTLTREDLYMLLS